MSKSKENHYIDRLGRFLYKNMFPLLFVIICAGVIWAAELEGVFLINELLIRANRNFFLVISLIIPCLAGMGMNFAIVVGAIAGQIGLIFIRIWDIAGIGGFSLALVISTPFALIFGWGTGVLLNKTKGLEMITGIILGFFASGLWQMIFILFYRTIIPLMGSGPTISLIPIQYSFDKLIPFQLANINIPLAGFIFAALLCCGITLILKSKLGRDILAVGRDRGLAESTGINVNRTRIIAILISTVIAAWG